MYKIKETKFITIFLRLSIPTILPYIYIFIEANKKSSFQVVVFFFVQFYFFQCLKSSKVALTQKHTCPTTSSIKYGYRYSSRLQFGFIQCSVLDFVSFVWKEVLNEICRKKRLRNHLEAWKLLTKRNKMLQTTLWCGIKYLMHQK